MATRIRAVQEWILEDHPYSDIIKSIVNKWGISIRQAERYHHLAMRFFEDKHALSMERKKAYYIQRKKKIIRDMDPQFKKTPSGARAINKILDSMAKLEGVVIDKIELSGKDGIPLPTGQSTVIILPSNNRE